MSDNEAGHEHESQHDDEHHDQDQHEDDNPNDNGDQAAHSDDEQNEGGEHDTDVSQGELVDDPTWLADVSPTLRRGITTVLGEFDALTAHCKAIHAKAVRERDAELIVHTPVMFAEIGDLRAAFLDIVRGKFE